MESKIKQWKTEKGIEIAAVIIEPIMSEGGDVHISGNFANKLRKLTKDLGVSMIVDEVQTGVCTTGTYWAHEQWDLYSPPDFMTFAKKMQSCGFYYLDEHSVETAYRHFNTFMGDPIRALITAAQNKVILRENLPDHCKQTGKYLEAKLQGLSEQHPTFVGNVRGRGTMLAFDVEDAAKRDQMVNVLRH